MFEAQILTCDVLRLLSFQVTANTSNNKRYSSMIASLKNSFALIQTPVTSKLQGFFSNNFIDYLIKIFSSIPNQNLVWNCNFKELSFGHFGFAYCKQAIWAHGNHRNDSFIMRGIYYLWYLNCYCHSGRVLCKHGLGIVYTWMCSVKTGWQYFSAVPFMDGMHTQFMTLA